MNSAGVRHHDGGDPFQLIDAGNAPILLVVDHASNRVPDDIDLRIDPELLTEHIAYDPGTAAVAALLVKRLGCRAILGNVSRLVLDLNREEDAVGLIPLHSDGHLIPGNETADRSVRLDRFHRPYHAEVAAQIERSAPPFLLSLHSFTPRLASDPDQQRPWEIGILYNKDRRGAALALPALSDRGVVVGDQFPYSGKLLNYTMNRHAEANGLPYLGVEMRQDLCATPQGQARMAETLAPIVEMCAAALL